MPDDAYEGDNAPLAEYRDGKRDVVKMAGAEPRIIGDQNIAFHKCLWRMPFDHRINRYW